ncbi:MAG: dTDP-4-dehydrorhamnose reductase [Synechococcales cyanobacterium RM1_1_8]|nr:dTDP-4-dehydrorhamnose reductase [Synechococcales cyanobacterium RM1_1_8]
MKKILLLGRNGQVGQELVPQLQPLGDLVSLGRDQLNLSQPEQVRTALQTLQPSVIVNAAAYTAVDKAESEPELAQAINGTAPMVLAQTAAAIGAQLIHISTDYVFDGQHHRPYREDHATAPLGAYGRSKQQGEQGICESAAQAIILRTAWVYGAKGHGNFVKTMLRVGAEREEIRVVDDQIGTPTWSHDIAQAICGLIQTTPLESQPGTEIYHFTNSGAASWYDFAVAIFEEAEQLGYPLKLRRLMPITTEEYPLPAPRPSYSVLCNQKIRQRLSTPAQHWRPALRKMLGELLQR